MMKDIYNEDVKYYRLSNPEMRVWYTEKIYQEPAIHNIGGYVQLSGTIDLSVMEQAINQVIKKNDGLRIHFLEEKGVPYQYVNPYQYQPVMVKDFTTEQDTYKAFQEWVEYWMPVPFNLYGGDLFHFALCKMEQGVIRIFVKIHHIIADGWAFQRIAELVTKEYYNIKEGKLDSELGESYIEYLDAEEKYLNSEQFVKNELYWLEQFKDIKEMNLLQSSKGVEGKRVTYELDCTETSMLKKFVEEEKILIQTAVMAAYYLYRSTCIKQKDITIEIPVFNRYGRKEKNTVGMFTSTMLYRFCIDDTSTISEYVNQMNRTLKNGLRNQRYPYNKLIEKLKLEDASLENMYDVSINYYNTGFNDSFKEWNATFEECYSGYQFFDLQIVIKEWTNSGKISFTYDYKTERYNEFQIKELHTHLKNILAYLQAHSKDLIGTVPVFQEQDYNKYIVDYNRTNCLYPKDKTILQLFEECVKQHPERIAVEYNGKELSYRELDKQANQLANYLYNNLHKRKEIIGIQTLHSIETVIAVLGVLKAGCIYLPLDPVIPEERLEYIVRNSGLTTILTNFVSAFEPKVDTVYLEQLVLEEYSSEKPDVEESADLVYIIYTSGTTGKPKGVMVTQQGLVNYICWAKKVYHVSEVDCVALYSSLAFDLTVTSIFTPLVSGARILVYRDDQEKYVLYRIIQENRSTLLKLTPAHLKLILDMDVSESVLTRLIVGGEDLKHQLAESVYQKFNSKITIFNEYGPTETVVGCMIYEYDESKCYGVSVPIGRPSDNVQIYLLDDEMQPVLPGQEGEIYIAGDGVARGYLNQEELTNQRFIPNPFSEKSSSMYKTGDIARFISETVMEYVCRVDNQIKVNGYRIELDEIEECIKKLDTIKEVVVDYCILPNKNQALCAFYSSVGELNVKTIRSHIRKFLPDYMVPVYFTRVQEFKLTVNGKLDRKSLPEIDMENKAFDMKLNQEKEEILSCIVKTILNLDSVNMNDNFFSIGGDSIKAIQLTSRLSEYGYKVNTKDVLASDCLGEIVELMELAQEKLYNVKHAIGSLKPLPIYHWFMDSNLENPNYYVQSIRIHLAKNVTASMLQTALQSIIKTHDAFRINFNAMEGFYYQEQYLEDEFRLICKSDNCNMEEEITVAKQSINIIDELPFKAILFERSKDDSNLLVLIAHHIVVDGVSWRIIADDLESILSQQNDGKEIKVIKEFATMNQWYEALEQYQNTAMEQIEYWNRQLEPYGMMKHWNLDSVKENVVQDNVTCTITVSNEDTNISLYQIASQSKFRIDEIILTAIIQVFTEQYNENEIVLLLESHGRESSIGTCDLSRTVGWFTSMYPVRFTFDDISDHILMLNEVKTYRNQVPDSGIGYGVLSYMLKKVEEKQQYIRFNYLGNIGEELKNRWITKIEPDFKRNSAGANPNSCLMDINCLQVNEQILVELTCSKYFLKEEELIEFSEHFKEKLNVLVSKINEVEPEKIDISNFTEHSLSQDDFDELFE